jgi:hypothetical protein
MKKIYSQLIFLFLLLFCIGMAHCKKAKEVIATNYVLELMTNGRWLVQTFTEDGVDESTLFGPYEFQFVSDGKVFAIEGASQTQGSWVANASAQTITSNFPVVNDTLTKLNDTWKITNSTTTMVEAKPTNTNRVAYLKLVKKP